MKEDGKDCANETNTQTDRQTEIEISNDRGKRRIRGKEGRNCKCQRQCQMGEWNA